MKHGIKKIQLTVTRATPQAIQTCLRSRGQGHERNRSKDDRGVCREDRKETEEVIRKETGPPGADNTQRTLTKHSYRGGTHVCKDSAI